MEAFLKVELRKKLGSTGSRELRASGVVPAVIYGKGKETSYVSVNRMEANTYFANVAKRECKIELDGKKHDVVIQEVQRHPISRDVMHIDFLRA